MVVQTKRGFAYIITLKGRNVFGDTFSTREVATKVKNKALRDMKLRGVKKKPKFIVKRIKSSVFTRWA